MHEEQPIPVSNEPPKRSEHVLIVDDSRAHRRLLSRSLAKWGYQVLEAESGEDALGICKSIDIGLIISDWIMPGMSGIDFCREYRSLNQSHAGYFILLTAQTERQALAEGLESGADDFLSKPVSSVELHARLKAGERVLKAQRELSSKNSELSFALERLTEAYSAIDKDLEEAKKFQETLVPETQMSLDSCNISLVFRPSGHVGGDMVGYFPVRDGEIGLYSIDVSGHGVSSALMTARVVSFFSGNALDRNIALKKTKDGYQMESPHVVCERLNRLLCNEAGSSHYLTMALAHLSTCSGEVRLCQAGHPSPVVVRANGNISLHEAFGMPVGLVDDATYETTDMHLDEGDKLLFYSDGITECPDETGQLLDEKGLIAAIRRHCDLKGASLLDAIVADVESFAGRRDLPDDLSAVLVERF